MSFNYKDYCEENLEKTRLTSSGQIEATCPWCGKYGSFYVNAETGDFICFRCVSDGIPAKGKNFVGVLAKVEGASYHEARGFMLRKMVQFRRKGSTKTLLQKIQMLRGEEPEIISGKVEVQLPEEFIPVWKNGEWNFPVYLKQRGIKKRTAKIWKLGFCRKGKYGNRIIIPIECPNGFSFVARDATGTMKQKILDPPNAGKSKLLFGWNHAKENSDLVLCEGPFDAIKLWQHGFNAVALLGKILHPAQLSLLLKRPYDSALTIMLDSEEVEAPFEIGKQVSCLFDRVQVAKLPEGTDPASAEKDEIHEAYEKAAVFGDNIAANIGAKLQKSKKKLSEVWQ